MLDAPTTFGSEGVGPDGGFAVPPEFRTTIMEVMGETELLVRTDLIDATGNSLTIPTHETEFTRERKSVSGFSTRWVAVACRKTSARLPACTSSPQTRETRTGRIISESAT
jgi:HK97 family phage major capsid protein